ncbi:MAG: RHS repeat-associated core domain-containing protein [Myxococcus sp.]|nr:RHS repeat-associated core domain-containing protein [Myxococcus sp.]
MTVTDENSVATTYTFEGNRPKTMTINGKTWTYTYDRGHLTKVQRPEGDYDVICYRRLPSNSFALNYGCPEGDVQNPSDEATAIFRYGSTGPPWSEATILNYGVDGELREELSYHQTNTTYTESTPPFRRTTRERNPLGFTTFEKTGPAPNGAAERTTRQFGADGLVVAQSTPYFPAPDFCGTPGAPSELCTKFQYWNTGRLKEMAVKPLDGANPDIRVCLDYDAHGNVTGVKPGCTTTGMHSYVWDDFGNVISAKLSTSDQPIRYETDARGNVIRKGMTVGGNTVELVWDYDLLNRPTQLRENGTIVSTWQYDSDPAQATNLPAGCTGPASPARTLGRLVWARDAVWRTWYSYDLFGRVTREARVNAAGLTCSSTSDLGRQQSIERTFTDNGNELTVKYPSGRTVTNSYDSTKRVSGMAMTTWNFAGWSAAPGTTMASNVSWFPRGNLKSYDLVTRPTLGGAPSTVTVSYRYGSAGNLPTDEIPSTTCATSEVDANGMGDSSGRLRAMYVTRGTTNMLRIFYRWRGEQLIEQSRCYLTSTTPEWEHFVDRTGADPAFQYDRAGRLGGGRLPNFGTTGGYCERRAYSYDTRGNRTQEKVFYGLGNDSYFSDWSRPDQLSATVYNNGSTSNPLLGWARDGNGTANVPVYSGRNRSYEYDSLGREMYITGTNGSSNWNMSFNGAFMGGAPVTGSESVLRAANLWDAQGGNQSFNYYYDTQNRRVRKQYPNGDLEGYFWDGDKRLLMETAPENIGSVFQAMDEYLWLGHLPILMLRSTYGINSSFWGRDRADWDSGWCVRRGAASACSPYGIVSDVFAKPVMTVDSLNRISGVLEYEPYGFTNRYSYWTDLSPAPDGCWWVAYGLNQGSSPLLRQMRVHLPRVEVGAPACLYQYVGGVQTDTACGQKWNYWTPWRDVPNGSSMDLVYCSNGTTPNPQPFGVTTDVYEYKEFEAGATPYTPPFRFQGQYFDAETDLHENWNRYYDPSTGRYLSPEPLLQNPDWAVEQLERGNQIPTYSYARNNPVNTTDPTGLAPCLTTYDCCIQNNPTAPEACGGTIGPRPTPQPAASDIVDQARRAVRAIDLVCRAANMANTAGCRQDVRDKWPDAIGEANRACGHLSTNFEFRECAKNIEKVSVFCDVVRACYPRMPDQYKRLCGFV